MGTEGDSFFVVFEQPTDAVAAALEAQRAIAGHGWPDDVRVLVRIGIHTGTAVRHETGFVGVDVHRAARVSGAAHGGQVLLSGVTADLVRDQLDDGVALHDLGVHKLKDLNEPERLVQVAASGLPTVFAPPRVEGAPELQVKGIADYRFVRFLGESGHGATYVAVPPARLGVSQPFVLVKLIPGLDSEAAARRAQREMAAFEVVESRYLVSVLDSGRDSGDFYYVMDFCELGSLASPERTLTRAEQLKAVADAARAAQAVHDAGLVHRGIKPSNVMLTADGGRLADLGMAQAAEPEGNPTSLGVMSGIDFMEPGLLMGDVASAASDIWSLAATLHWALAGEGLYGELPTADPLYCIRQVMTTAPKLGEHLASGDAALLSRCLVGPKDGRPASAGELADAIEALSD